VSVVPVCSGSHPTYLNVPLQYVLSNCQLYIIGSWLDYCNSPYYGTSNTNFQRLQRVQNAAERFAQLFDDNITQSTYTKGFSLAICAWQSRLQDCRRLPKKLSRLSYLTCLLSSYRQSHVLRSSTLDLLSAHSLSTYTAARWISCCTSTVWNSLPSFVRTADSFTSCCSQFKKL